MHSKNSSLLFAGPRSVPQTRAEDMLRLKILPFLEGGINYPVRCVLREKKPCCEHPTREVSTGLFAHMEPVSYTNTEKEDSITGEILQFS